jgi:transcriptional regulator with GAF, ATPase, and Fis domain
MTIPVWLRDLVDTSPRYLKLVRDALSASLTESDDAALGVIVMRAFLPDTLRRVRLLAERARVIVLLTPETQLSTEAKWALMATGAVDVLDWPGAEQLASSLLPRLIRLAEIETMIENAAEQGVVVGQSGAWRNVLRQAVEIAVFSGAGLLLTGETGTGKEQIARLIHAMDRRPQKAEFVVVDCTTLSRELSGSELFGHERGAFTGAVSARDGAIAQAHHGTLFLDEIGELDQPLQAQLLRVIQERNFKRVGSNIWQRADFRLICATNRDLEVEVAERRFRADLYFRIADRTLHLPPLRQRREDILALSRHFWRLSKDETDEPKFDTALEQILVTRDYPGNVRDLRRIAMAIRARHVGGGQISLGALPDYVRPAPLSPDKEHENPAMPPTNGELSDNADFIRAIEWAIAGGACLKSIGRAASSVAIRVALQQESGNLQRAAKRLGVTDRALQMRRANDQTIGAM